MATRSRATRQELKLMDLLRMGGTKIPAGFASKALAATKARLQKELDAGNAQRKQGARLFGRLKGTATVSVKDPANKKALDELLRWHKKLAGKKLAFPKVPGGFGCLVPGSISGTIVPPFDFADTIPTLLANVTNPTLSASANVNGRNQRQRRDVAGAGLQWRKRVRKGGNLLSSNDRRDVDDFGQSQLFLPMVDQLLKYNPGHVFWVRGVGDLWHERVRTDPFLGGRAV